MHFCQLPHTYKVGFAEVRNYLLKAIHLFTEHIHVSQPFQRRSPKSFFPETIFTKLCRFSDF